MPPAESPFWFRIVGPVTPSCSDAICGSTSMTLAASALPVSNMDMPRSHTTSYAKLAYALAGMPVLDSTCRSMRSERALSATSGCTTKRPVFCANSRDVSSSTIFGSFVLMSAPNQRTFPSMSCAAAERIKSAVSSNPAYRTATCGLPCTSACSCTASASSAAAASRSPLLVVGYVTVISAAISNLDSSWVFADPNSSVIHGESSPASITESVSCAAISSEMLEA